jgi:hypothetical protein
MLQLDLVIVKETQEEGMGRSREPMLVEVGE